MMSRFTERAQEALQRAQQIMFAKQHTQLDVEHIFLALLRQPNSLPDVIIMQLGGDVPMMAESLDAALSSMRHLAGGRGMATGFITLRANRTLQGAIAEAEGLGDEFISTEHLLLSISNERGGASGRILQAAGIDRTKIYAALREIRGGEFETRHKSQAARGRNEPDEAPAIINPPQLARPVGFSHGILASGTLLFLAGQTAMDAEGKIVSHGDVVGQYRQVLGNLRAVVEAAGGAMADIAKMTIFVKDRDDYKAHLRELGQVHKEFFGTYYPATALLEVSRFFDDGVLVEIEGIAVL